MELNNYYKKIINYIKRSNYIYIMAHDGLDLDAISSCIAISDICSFYKRKNAIIIDEKNHESGVSAIIKQSSDKYNYIKSNKVIHNDDNLLILVDVNKTFLLQCKNILDKFKNIVIIDHHETTKETINGTYNYILPNVSSTSEIITDIFRKIKIKNIERTCTYLLAGIILDTNSFSLKTTANTYNAALYLTNNGANNKISQSLLKQNIDDYKLRQKAILDFKLYNKNIAISVCSQKIIYKREELAKIADTLLEFNDIEMSFVIGKIGADAVGISARSSGRKSVGRILEKIGGGGNKNEAACRFENISLKDALNELRKVI